MLASDADGNLIDLSIIIVSWNVRELLDKCLASLQQTRRTIRPDDCKTNSA